MARIANPKVQVVTNENDPNPFKKGTAKAKLMVWALDRGTFTKDEFLAEHKRLRELGEFESVMTIDVAGKAWWNEFYNKHEMFVVVTE